MERTNLIESKLKELREVWIWTKIFACPRPILIVCLFYQRFVLSQTEIYRSYRCPGSYLTHDYSTDEQRDRHPNKHKYSL